LGCLCLAMTMVADVIAMSMSSAEVHVGNSGTAHTFELVIWTSNDDVVVNPNV